MALMMMKYLLELLKFRLKKLVGNEIVILL